MDIAEFRKHGHQLIDWMADYMDTVEKFPVRSQVCLLYTSPSPRDMRRSRMPSSA